MSLKSRSLLAVDGGNPVRGSDQHWPEWPVFDEAEERALLGALRSGKWWYAEGTEGKAFETEFASYHGARFGIACVNGTAALEIALRGLDIGPGDEVIVPPYTFIATATAVLAVGATPIFADIDSETLNIDPGRIREAITSKTRAVIAVHMAGRPADLDELTLISRDSGIILIEDAAQAHGAAWRGRHVGPIGAVGTFSFQASKNVSGGEGGILVTNDEELAERLWSIVNVGRPRAGRWYEHQIFGGNYRISEFQSAVLRVQLRRLAVQTRRRTDNAAYLRSLLDVIPGVNMPPVDPRITTHANHLFPLHLRLDSQGRSAFGGRTYEEFIATLTAEGIPCSDGYVPIYREGVFAREAQRVKDLGIIDCRLDYPSLRMPECERACGETVWLTQNLLLGSKSDVAQIAEAIDKIRLASSRK